MSGRVDYSQRVSARRINRETTHHVTLPVTERKRHAPGGHIAVGAAPYERSQTGGCVGEGERTVLHHG